MGRRRHAQSPTCGDTLPEMVRHKNAVNMELTLAARSQDVWLAIESGKERRLRLACERMYGLDGSAFSPMTSPIQSPVTPIQEKPPPVQLKPVTEKTARKGDAKKGEENKSDQVAVKDAKTAKKNETKQVKELKQAGDTASTETPTDNEKSDATDGNRATKASVNSSESANRTAVAKQKPNEEQEKSNKNKLKANNSTGNAADSVVLAPLPNTEVPVTQGKVATPLAANLSQMATDESSPSATAAKAPVTAQIPLASAIPEPQAVFSSVNEPSNASISPKEPLSPPPVVTQPKSSPVAVPSASPTTEQLTKPSLATSPTSCLSYADKVKIPPSSPPKHDEPPPPAREESPEPLYDPTPRARTPPPAVALSPTGSHECEDWHPVETRKEKRARRRSERMSESEKSDGGETAAPKTEGAQDSPEPIREETDAFDLLMSGGDDLTQGFQEAFGDDTEIEDGPRTDAPAADAIDLLMDASDDLHDGFEEAFAEDLEKEEAVKKSDKTKKSGKKTQAQSQAKTNKAKQTSESVPKEPSPPKVNDAPKQRTASGKKPRSRKNSENTKETRKSRTPRQSESDSAPPITPGNMEWFDKAQYDAAEVLFYETQANGISETLQNGLKKTSMKQNPPNLSLRMAQSHVDTISSSRQLSSAEGSLSNDSSRARITSQPILQSTQPPQGSEPSSLQSQPLSSPPPSECTQPFSLGSQTQSLSLMSQSAFSQSLSQPQSLTSQPVSLNSQDLYYEDVVLPNRKSSATMATMPGFTAETVSENLAPGEQLDSLKAMPEMEPDEPSENSKSAKNKKKRRRRRSERVSESDKHSEELVDSGSINEQSEKAASPEQDLAGSTTTDNSQQKSGKSRQRRKKTKSTSSLSEAADKDDGSKNKPIAPTAAKTNTLAPDTSQRLANTEKSENLTSVSPSPVSKQPPSPSKPSSSGSSGPSSPEHGPILRPEDKGKRYASLLQQGGDMLPARPVFLAHACFVCKRLHSKQCRLKSCGSCRLVAYCSPEHQRAHWPLHRALCKVITKKMRKQGTDHIYREAYNVTDPEQWKQIRFKNMTICEEMLGRPMEAHEKEMFLYPRVCDTCHETMPEKLHTCHSCHSVSYCNEAHLRKTHAKYCKDLRLLVDIHTYQNEHGICDPELPEKMLTEYDELPGNIREFLVVTMLGPMKAYSMGNVELAVLSENASYPLTMLYALQNIPVAEDAHISRRTELTVHVVGAEFSAECDTISKWDVFLLNVLPKLKKLHVVFIGPELDIGPDGRPGVTDEDFTCESSLQAGKKFTCEFQPCTYYHSYCRSPQFRPPNVICAFNAGIYRTTGHERRDSWLETIPYLVRDDVPLVVTAYTMLECPQDVARIQQLQRVDVLLPPIKNPYRSTRPAQNFLNEHEEPLIYKNQYVACLSAAHKRK